MCRNVLNILWAPWQDVGIQELLSKLSISLIHQDKAAPWPTNELTQA